MKQALRLDPTEQRIVGTLIEKQLSVPDSYPLTEHALVAGCNQSNNRDPVTAYEVFQVAGALMALQQKGVLARIDGAGRVPKYRHKLDEILPCAPGELPVFAELLLRGPQAPGALKPRVGRMGCQAEAAAIEALLRGLASRSVPLVEQLPLGPRERDRRWRHLLGDGSPAGVSEAGPAAAAPAPVASEAPRTPVGDLAVRVADLERQVLALQAELAQLRAR
ncbi:MAG: DUF480 domain-containing protein [Planctomycetes bacterium]|nr:DUF480 domain-containing protein [Planctomycetota bacterium]